jgi:hypothetical protein
MLKNFIFGYFLLIFFEPCIAQNCNNGDLNMVNIPNCTGAINLNSGTSSPLDVGNNQIACTSVANSTFTINQVNMTPANDGGSTLIIRNNNNVTINTLNIQNNNNNRPIEIYVEAGAMLTILNSINTPRRTRFINYGTLNFGANPSGTATITVQNDNNLFQNAVGATMRFNSTLNFASGNNTQFVNNGIVTAGTMTINSNSVRYIQGNNATTSIATLSQNNQTNVLCVPNNTCAKFTVTTSIPQLNNQLTQSNGSNMGGSDRGEQIVCYQGTAANYRGGSATFPSGIGSPFSTDCASNCLNILPIRLLYFSVIKQDDGIKISWATTQENNNQSFEIQRSKQGIDFETIGKVEGKIDMQSRQEYDFFDMSFPSGRLYYRLRQVDIDGTVTYFKSVSLQAGEKELIIYTFPNPIQDKLNIMFSKAISYGELRILDLRGDVIYSDIFLTETTHIEVFTSKIEQGVYLLHLITPQKVFIRKIIRI